MPIDFTELGDADRPGYGLQGLARALARKSRSWKNTYWSGYGQDGQKDLIFLDPVNNRKWLVSCKDNSVSQASVSPNDVQNVTDRLVQHKCNSFLLITTTGPTNGLKTMIDALDEVQLATGEIIKTEIWDRHKLTEMLAEPDCRAIARIYFPKSSGELGSTDLLSSTDFITVLENIAAQDNNAIELFKTLIDEIQNQAIRLTIAEYILENLPAEEHLLDLLSGFDNEELEILSDALSDEFQMNLQEYLWVKSDTVGIDAQVDGLCPGGYIEEIYLERTSLKMSESQELEVHVEVTISVDNCPSIKGYGKATVTQSGYSNSSWEFNLDNSDWYEHEEPPNEIAET